MVEWSAEALLPSLVEQLDVGIVVLDREYNTVSWNSFMANYSGVPAEQVLGKCLFDVFPDLPRKWLELKLSSVAMLKNYAFTSWEQRPWLFRFNHKRPITGGIDYMQQNCVFMPLQHGGSDDVDFIALIIFDVTDTALYQRQLADALAELERSSITDGLTQAYNRRYLQQRIAAEFQRVQRRPSPLSLVMFDLDHFKKVNDGYGHLGGDAVLKEVASRVLELVRSHDVFGRYGGEEFTVLLPDTDLDGAAAVAERIRHKVMETPVAFGDISIAVTASLGVATFNPKMAAYLEFIQAADEALYRAKRGGRNQVVISSE